MLLCTVAQAMAPCHLLSLFPPLLFLLLFYTFSLVHRPVHMYAFKFCCPIDPFVLAGWLVGCTNTLEDNVETTRQDELVGGGGERKSLVASSLFSLLSALPLSSNELQFVIAICSVIGNCTTTTATTTETASNRRYRFIFCLIYSLRHKRATVSTQMVYISLG